MKKRCAAALAVFLLALAASPFLVNQKNGVAESEDAGDSVEKIVVSYLVSKKAPEDLDLVTERLNEILEEKAGIQVSWRVVLMESQNDSYSSLISSGEQLDLICFAFTDMGEFVRSGQLLDLNGLSGLSAVSELIEDSSDTEGGIYDGGIYGVSRIHTASGAQSGYILKKKYLDEIGEDLKDQYTLEELGEIFAKIKALYPDVYPCGLTEGDFLEGSSIFTYVHEADVLGASLCSGVLLDVETPEVENPFASEDYRTFIETMYQWQQEGYILPDAMTCDLSGDTLLRNDVTAGYFMNVSPNQLTNAMEIWGEEFAALPLTRPYQCGNSSSNGIYWSILAGSEAPEAAARFLNLMMTDEEIANLLNYGIEGIHYEKESADEIRLTDPEKYGGNGLKFIGTPSMLYQTEESSGGSDTSAYMAACAEHTSVAAGYVYNPEGHTKEIQTIEGILDDYLPVLETGSAQDPEAVYEEFLEKLEAAGIEEVVRDNQRQLDAWLSD